MARSSLREFQERLARRLAEAKTAERRGLLGFQCGGENWLIALPEAGEILPPPALSAVPLTQPWYRGLANVRGTLYGVIDFARFNGQPPTVAAGRARLLLLTGRMLDAAQAEAQGRSLWRMAWYGQTLAHCPQ